MSATLPKIVIAFKALASTFIARSERGVAILIVREEGKADGDDYVAVETSVTEVNTESDLSGWSNANAARIADMLAINPAKTVVVTIDTNADVKTATAAIEEKYMSGRVTIVGKAATDYTALATWAKARKTFHALVFNTTNQNSKYVENVYSQNITFSKDWDYGRLYQGELDRSMVDTYTTEELLPLICAILSRANVDGASSTVLTALEGVVDVSEQDDKVNKGNIILYNDWKGSERVVRLGTAVNTLTSFDAEADNGDQIEDMRYIEVAEAADMIRADITAVFRDEYSGQMKNSVDNQMQFLGAVANYFDGLEEDEVLSPTFANTADIDVEAQRKAWMQVNPDAANWDDDKVKATPFKRQVFISADVQILQSIQDLKMVVNLN